MTKRRRERAGFHLPRLGKCDQCWLYYRPVQASKMPVEKAEEHPAVVPAIQDGELSPSGAPEPAADVPDEYGDVMRALGVPELVGNGDPSGIIGLVEIRREMGIGHEVPAKEINGL